MYPHLGSFIAVVEIDDDQIPVEQTGRDLEHFTIWAEPDAQLRAVTAVVAV
jgi:hypothetical protein